MPDSNSAALRPLAGVRVVDLADGRGELCGRLLADLGADVLRIEKPGGAASRGFVPLHGGVSLHFAWRNANKRVMLLFFILDRDIRHERGLHHVRI